MDTVFDALVRAGGLARATSLRASGFSRRAIDAAVRDGTVFRLVRPWVATADAPLDAVIAILHHGRLTDASALGSYGVWRGGDRSIHVQLSPNARGAVSASHPPLALFAPPEFAFEGVVRHWVEASRGDHEWRVAPADALASFARSQSPEMFIAAVDSAVHRGILKPSDLPLLRALLPRDARRSLARTDKRAESGCESLARLRLASIGHHIDIQVSIGRHRVDLLVDGWLVIEIDSERWHSGTRVADSRRDTLLIRQGYRVKHFDYAEVMHEWPAVEAAVAEMLRNPPSRRPGRSL